MKRVGRFLAFATCLSLLLTLGTGISLADPAAPQGDARALGVLGMSITYQGYLTDDGVPAQGPYDFLFTLFSPEGTQIADPLSLDDVPVIRGRFTVSLDFGHYAFLGWERELEIAVRPGDS